MSSGSVCLLVLLGLLAVAATTDIRSRLIPNVLPVAVLLLWCISALMFPEFRSELGWRIASFATMVVLGLALFTTGIMGGGDIKLLAALSVWHPLAQLPELLLAIGIFGAGVALVYAFSAWARGARLQAALKTAIPYGVAILLGEAWILMPGLGLSNGLA